MNTYFRRKIEGMANSMVISFLDETPAALANTESLMEYAKANFRAASPEWIFNAALDRATSILCQALVEAA